MAFKIVRLEDRIAPSRMGCYGGSGKGKSGSGKGKSGSKCKGKSGSGRGKSNKGKKCK